jgi:hypothetical protein
MYLPKIRVHALAQHTDSHERTRTPMHMHMHMLQVWRARFVHCANCGWRTNQEN